MSSLRPSKEDTATCNHRIADMTNEHIKSGFMCIDCGKLFEAAPPVKQEQYYKWCVGDSSHQNK